MSTMYLNLNDSINLKDIEDCLLQFDKDNQFINYSTGNENFDFFKIQKTNNCNIKIFKHFNKSKIILVSLIDNLLKGAAGQAVQSMNIMCDFDEKKALNL